METFDHLEEMNEWAAQVEARHNFPDSGDDLDVGGFPW